MNSEKRLEISLLLLRLGVFIVMFMWTIDKFVKPDHAIGIFKKYYFLGWSTEIMYAVGIVELVVILGFLAGYMKRWTYGLVLLFHAGSTFMAFPRYLFDPWKSLTLFAAWPMFAACITLYLLRDQDTLFALEKRKRAS